MTTYSDEQLAALLVLLFRNNLDGNTNFGDFQTQIDQYVKIADTLPDGDDFKTSIHAIADFYKLNPTIVLAAHKGLADLFTAFETAAQTGAVRWGECSYVSLVQINTMGGLALVPPAPKKP